ncbi:GntR family transcriptional regulator [Streptomyces lunaelactis]|uniref:GntR family transcriptional regulator n=1 Tax=Streptomyces lunaelactis TaxID=1535768 RepID=UPI0015855053|nr:GntR family transcriptional regulator [Streptomyces lunaelactis]NUK24767.1 GntR family transcriptional regulator [Streptomyces lunaelactis]
MTVPTTEANAFDHRSLHERIAADLRDETMSGDLGPGAKLPSTVQLKARFDASNATVQKALQLLKDERLVIGRAGAAVTVREHRQRTALNLPEGGTALLRRQVLMLDDEPAELVTSYYPVDIARGTAMMDRRKIKGGTPTLLAELGYPPRLSVDRISARVPTQEQYAALQLPSDLPVLRTLRVVYSDHDRAIEATVMVKAGHLYELQYEFTPE